MYHFRLYIYVYFCKITENKSSMYEMDFHMFSFAHLWTLYSLCCVIYFTFLRWIITRTYLFSSHLYCNAGFSWAKISVFLSALKFIVPSPLHVIYFTVLVHETYTHTHARAYRYYKPKRFTSSCPN